MEAARIATSPDTAVCRIGSALDFHSADAFRRIWEPLLEGGTRNFVLDLSRTGVMDSAGLGTILTLHRRLRDTGGRVLLAAPTPAVKVVIDLTKCDRILGNFASVDLALHALN